MQSTPSLPSIPGKLWLRVVATELFEIELFKLFLNWIAWNTTVFDIETVYLR